MLLVLLYPIQVSPLLWIKFTMSKLLLLFLCNFYSFFSYVRGALVTRTFCHCYWLIYFVYSANYNTRGAFVIILLICSDLLNSLESVGTIAITTEMVKTASKLFSLSNSSLKSPFLRFLCTATPNISSSNENINNTARVSRLSFCFLWLYLNTLWKYLTTLFLFLHFLIISLNY